MDLIKVKDKFKDDIIKASNIVQQCEEIDVTGICIVGSSVNEDWEEGSDIDMVFAIRKKVDYRTEFTINDKIEETCKHRMQLVFLEGKASLEEYHFDNRTTMAHSIKNGIIILDQNNSLNKFSSLAGTPKISWIKDYFCRFQLMLVLERENVACRLEDYQKYRFEEMLSISNTVCRVIVNYAILYLELKGIIPTTKKEIVRGLESRSFIHLKDVKKALKIRRSDCDLKSQKEYESFLIVALNLEDKITEILCREHGYKPEDFAEAEGVLRLMRETRSKAKASRSTVS